MWGKLLAALAIVAIVGTAGLVCDRIVIAYGNARYAAGKADAQLAAVPGILAANEGAAKSAIDARDRVILAASAYADRAAALKPIILTNRETEVRYAESAAGKLDCRDAERVQAVDVLDATLFPPAAASDPGSGARPVQADSAAPPAGGTGHGRR